VAQGSVVQYVIPCSVAQLLDPPDSGDLIRDVSGRFAIACSRIDCSAKDGVADMPVLLVLGDKVSRAMQRAGQSLRQRQSLGNKS